MENELVRLFQLDNDIFKFQTEIAEIETLLDKLDEQIQKYEDTETDLVNLLAETYNELNVKKLKLELRRNYLEKQLLQIEYEHAIAE